MAGEWVRWAGFWTVDFLRGSAVRKHYLDVKNIMQNADSPLSARTRAQHLERMLRYAVDNVPYYRQFKGFTSLTSFPVINKGIMKAAYADFQSPGYTGEKLVRLHSSGSTGMPFFVSQDRNKRNRVYAEMLYFWGKAGYRIGMRYVFFRLWSEDNRKSRLTAWARNLVMWDIQQLDEGNLANIRSMLRSDRRIRMLIGYASTLETLADYLESCGDTPDHFRYDLILSGSEILTESARARIRQVFGCPVVSVYSNQENGLLAAECPQCREFHLNDASYHIELLKFDSDQPAAAGELGRIVVTDLFNRAMPLIRYDTGDAAVAKQGTECDWQTRAFALLEGRAVDIIYDTRGNRLSPFVVGFTMWPYDKVKQFQFIQEGAKQYRLKVIGAREHYNDSVFEEEFRKKLGPDAEIAIDHVAEISSSPSGKRRVVINNYRK